METSNDCFIAALKKELKKQGRGVKKKLAASVGVSPNHLSDILAQRKNAGQNLKERIAESLGLSFEEMLVLGRRNIENRTNEETDRTTGKERVLGSVGTMGPQREHSTGFLVMAEAILMSNSPYRQALISNIMAYHQAMDLTHKEKKALELLQTLQQEMNTLRRDIDELKRTEKDEGDSPHRALA